MKKRLLCGIAVLLCICTVCVCLPKPYAFIRNFNYAELPVRFGLNANPEFHEIDSLEEKLEKTKNLTMSHYDTPNIIKAYGFAAIVTVMYSTNYQWREDQDENNEFLNPNRVYDDPQFREQIRKWLETGKGINRDERKWRAYGGRVVTTAKIEKILVEPENSKFKEGNTIRIEEPYTVWDQRTPHVVEYRYQVELKNGSTPYCGALKDHYAIYSNYNTNYSYAPLEAGETYLIVGGIWNNTYTLQEDIKGFYVYYSSWLGYNDLSDLSYYEDYIYCLSDKTKPAGTPKSPEQLEADYAYIAEHFGY